MTKCTSCGRNTKSENNQNSPNNCNKYCAECCDIQGNLLPFSEVLENFANHFMNTLGYDIAVSRNAAMEILKRQPAWEPMFKKEEKMRTKKKVFAIVAGALALILAVTGVVYGFYRYFGTPRFLFLEKETKLEKIKNGDTILKELKTEGQVIILKTLNDKNLVIFASWTGNNWQDYLYDLDVNKGYFLPSSSDWVSDGYGGMRYLYYDTYSYLGIDGDYFCWQSFENRQFLLKMIKVDEIIKANTQAFANTNDSAENRYDMFNEICRKKTITIASKKTSFTNLVKHGNILVWEDDRNYDTTSTDIYGFNILAEKEFPICAEIGDQKNMILKGDKIFWEDYRNVNRKGFEIYYYDLKNNTENIIPYAEKIIGDCTWTANKDFVCYSGQTIYSEEYAKGIYIYSLNTGKTEIITENKISSLKIYYNSVEDCWEYYSVWPSQILISEPDKNNDFYIAWGEVSGFKFRNSNTNSTVIAFKKYSEITKPTKYIDKPSLPGSCQSIQGLSNSGIVWINHLGNKNSKKEIETSLKIYQFDNNKNVTIEDVYKEDLFDEFCQINDSYAVWPPIDKQEWRAINLRYMKIR